MSLAGAETLTAAARPAGDRTWLAGMVLFALAAALALATLLSIASGPTGFMPLRALTIMASHPPADDAGFARDALVILEIRLPRALLGILIGAALAVAGCVMQGLFRNPLADPGLVGTSSGAALAAVTAIVLGGPFTVMLPDWARPFALPAAAFVGALVATALLYAIATRDGRTSIGTMLLAGIALAALAAAGVGMLVFVSTDLQLRELTFWSLGSLAGATWEKVAVASPFILAALLAFVWLSRDLDAILLGETEAGYLGVSLETLKRVAVVAVAGAVGAAVAVSGAIGFVGIVVPHLLRLAIGPTHRALIPASALLGAILLLAADIASRTIVAPAELPIGILTALFGAPFFLWLLLSRRSLVDI